MKRGLVAVITAAVLVAVGTAAPAVAASVTATAPGFHPTALSSVGARPSVLFVDAHPGVVKGSGGSVLVSAEVHGATRCNFAGQRRPRGAVVPRLTVDCASGHASARLPVVANPFAQAGTIRFVVTAVGPRGRARGTATVIEAAGGGNVPPPSPSPPPPPPPPPAPSWQQSPNWSGYVVPSSGVVTSVSGSWTVPTVNCSATPNAGVSTWIGIGGTGSETLLQTGIRETCSGGVGSYVGWFEEYPSSPNTEVDFYGFPVSPGDAITASVYQITTGAQTGAWETCVQDLTTGLSGLMVTGAGWGVSSSGCAGNFFFQGRTVGLSYPGGHTAEWIVEDYAQRDGTMIPFAAFGSVTFGNLRTSLASWSLTANEGWEIVQNGVILSTPSLPGSDGDSFTVSYTSSG